MLRSCTSNAYCFAIKHMGKTISVVTFLFFILQKKKKKKKTAEEEEEGVTRSYKEKANSNRPVGPYKAARYLT